MQTRRAALLTMAGAAASPLLAQHLAPVFFTPSDYAIVSRLADLILPRTDTPGALDAQVPFRIDAHVKASPALQQEFEEGLASLRASSFLSLSEAQQIALLTSMTSTPFFVTVKNLTIDWYYRSEEGLVQELGFHGNTFNAEFPGCTHPEHWPK